MYMHMYMYMYMYMYIYIYIYLHYFLIMSTQCTQMYIYWSCNTKYDLSQAVSLDCFFLTCRETTQLHLNHDMYREDCMAQGQDTMQLRSNLINKANDAFKWNSNIRNIHNVINNMNVFDCIALSDANVIKLFDANELCFLIKPMESIVQCIDFKANNAFLVRIKHQKNLIAWILNLEWFKHSATKYIIQTDDLAPESWIVFWHIAIGLFPEIAKSLRGFQIELLGRSQDTRAK